MKAFKWINNILEAGIFEDTDEIEKRRIRLLNHLILIAVLPTVVFGFLDVLTGYYEMLLSVVVLILLAISEQMLVRRRRYTLAKHLTYAIFLLAIASTAIIVGDQADAQNTLIAMVVVPWLIFRSSRTSIILFLITVLAYVAIIWAQSQIEPIIVLENELVELYTVIVGVVIMIIIFVFTGYSKNVNGVYEKLIIQQKEQVAGTLGELTDSINYAKRLQMSILPDEGEVKKYLPDCFILYKPKDIVAGDFYWMETYAPGGASAPKGNNKTNNLAAEDSPKGDLSNVHQSPRVAERVEAQGDSGENVPQCTYIAAADCTGHGVPGAMVSVVCANALSKSVVEEGIREPAKILDRTREIVSAQFDRHGSELQDGMDIGLVKIDVRENTCQLSYAGANRPLWVVRKNSDDVEEYRGDKQPVSRFEYSKPFTQIQLDLAPGDAFYISSDGFPDQFGGEKGKKLKPKNLKKLILQSSSLSPEEQCKYLDRSFEEWRGELEQIDDVCVVGVRI